MIKIWQKKTNPLLQNVHPRSYLYYILFTKNKEKII